MLIHGMCQISMFVFLCDLEHYKFLCQGINIWHATLKNNYNNYECQIKVKLLISHAKNECKTFLTTLCQFSCMLLRVGRN